MNEKDGNMFLVKNIVGSQVKLTRKQLEMTRDELAVKLQLDGWDISRSGVAKIEIGIRQVTDIEVTKLAKALHVSVSWLFGEE